ncbi:MAG: hypothetical protein L6Q57_04200 [Alphaproteobacteria bacterium]|nr:hypothetical protein [Alphaproteobacteria bacterium]
MSFLQSRFLQRGACLFILFFALLDGGGINAAWAQQNVPASVDPSRTQDRLSRPLPQARPSIEVPRESEETQFEIPEGAEQYRFILRGIVIEGASVWPQNELAKPLQSKIGQSVSVADVFRLAGQITQKYRDAGFILSRAVVPEQEIDKGFVRIQVVEGYVSEVVLTGKNVPPFPVQDIKNTILSYRPLNIHDLERQLLLLNRLTGQSARGYLESVTAASEKSIGGIRLNVVFTTLDNQYSAGIDNYGSKFVGAWQSSARAYIPHGGILPGALQASIATTTQRRELSYFSISDRFTASPSGLMMSLGAQYSRSQPGFTLTQQELYSRYRALDIGLDYPLILSRANNLFVNTGLEIKNVESDILHTRLYDDRLRVLRAGLNYESALGAGTSSTINLAWKQGLDIFGSRETGSPDLSRAEGHSDFSKIELGMTTTQALENNFGLSVDTRGQISFSPLLSSEEFGYGGYSTGRAYDSAEITGDSGMSMLAEIFYNHYIQMPNDPEYSVLQPYLFYDIGKVWNRDQGSEPESGSSVGVGARLKQGSNAQLDLTIAQPLTRPIENPLSGNGNNPRVLMSLQMAF